LFLDIMEGTANYSMAIVQLTAKHLTVALDNMLAEIEKNGSLQLPIKPNFRSYETLEEMCRDYYLFFDQFKANLIEKRSGKQEELIRKINQIISERYADPNLSLNLISDVLNMSSYHLSRVYRQQTLVTIVDTINHVRMEHAKEQLIKTDNPVSEIAEKTGYTSSSYFHRMFKKMYGVTPSEYRNANS
jgi:two-component system response regulator YesN